MPFISFTMATYLNVSIELLGNLLMEFPRKRGFYGLRTELQRICHHFQSAVRRNASPRHWYAFLQGNVRLWYSVFTLSQSTWATIWRFSLKQASLMPEGKDFGRSIPSTMIHSTGSWTSCRSCTSWKINASAGRLNTARHRKNAAKEKTPSVTEKD